MADEYPSADYDWMRRLMEELELEAEEQEKQREADYAQYLRLAGADTAAWQREDELRIKRDRERIYQQSRLLGNSAMGGYSLPMPARAMSLPAARTNWNTGRGLVPRLPTLLGPKDTQNPMRLSNIAMAHSDSLGRRG